MLEKIVELSIRQRFAVLAAVLICAAVGIYSFGRLKIDAVPDITHVQVQVNTAVPALAPEEIENLVTFPIETEMAGLPGMTDLRMQVLWDGYFDAGKMVDGALPDDRRICLDNGEAEIVNADLSGHAFSRPGIIACEHDDLHTHITERPNGVGRRFLDGIGDGKDGHGFIPASKIDDGLSVVG